ncbi:MAG: methylamine utilization protein [Proteobacteria bacterium]|nr:methylamine utilization protein [Pseudomonadota bacterium]
MRGLRQGIIGLACLVLAAAPLAAADLVVQVTDADGRPVADAVVTLAPEGVAAAGTPMPRRNEVDQRNETFVPYVQIVPRGGEVAFKNSDLTRHHVYSFSPARAFEFVLAPGQQSDPVRFERAGVVAIGCNIHDRMVAYLYVADAPWATLTDAEGRAVLSGVPEASYAMRAWHPRARPGRPEPSQKVTVGSGANQATVSLALLREPSRQLDRDRARY